MSSLYRFKTGNVWYKARIYERASRKRDCSCCRQRKFGVLIRHINPIKKDTIICDECLIKLSLGQTIKIPDNPDALFGIYLKAQPKKKKVPKGRKKGTKLTPEQRAKMAERQRATRARTKALEEAVAKEVEEKPVEAPKVETPPAIESPVEAILKTPLKSDYDLNKRSISYGEEEKD